MATNISKESSLNIISKTTSQQLELESSNSHDRIGTIAEDLNQDKKDVPPSSQTVTQETLQRIVGDVVEEQRKCEAEKKKKILESYKQDYKETRDIIDDIFNDHEQKAAAIHQLQLKRLQSLLDQKTKIETAMERELAHLKAEYKAHSDDLQACIDRRIKEMQ